MPARGAGQGIVLVLATCPDREVGERIARVLVEERLAACVNLIPGLTSIYRWQGKVCRAAEVLLVIKTHRRRLPGLTRRVKALHPYSVPEVIVLPLTGGLAPYLAWVRDSTT